MFIIFTSNEQTENEIKKTDLMTIASKNKYLGLNLTKEEQDLSIKIV